MTDREYWEKRLSKLRPTQLGRADRYRAKLRSLGEDDNWTTRQKRQKKRRKRKSR